MEGLSKAALLCAVLGGCLYINTLDCGFCFDDDAAVEKNKDLRPNVSWSNLIWDDFWGLPLSDKDSHKSYRPLCVATFRLNYMVHGLEPMGYHLVNVLLHGVVCYLYVQLCGVIFLEVWPALIAGLLFAVHPIHTEAVAGVVGRADIMAGMFFISAVLVYIWSVLVRGKTYSGLLFSIGLCLSSVLSKEIGITSVVLCLVYEYFTHRKMTLLSTLFLLHNLWRKGNPHLSRGNSHLNRGNPPSWCYPFLVRVGIIALWTLTFLVFRVWFNKGSPIFSVHNNPALSFPSPYRQLHWSYLIFYNIQLLLFPSSLNAEYAMSTLPPITSITDHRNTLTLLTFLTVSIFGWLALTSPDDRKRSPLVFGLAMMVFPFLPASNLFFPVGFVVAERVLYLPSMGFCMLVALGVWHLYPRYPSILKVGVFYVLIVHSGKTLVRNRDWYSSITLFQSAIVMFPNNAKMFNNLAAQVDMAGNQSLAVDLFNHSIHVEPHFITAYNNLAYILRNQSDMENALKVYQEAADLVARGLSGENIHVTPKNVKVFNSLSNMLREHFNDGLGALKYALKAIDVEPEWENGYHSKANALVIMGRLTEAKVAFEKAIKINPRYAIAYSNYGNCLQKMDLYQQAEKQYRLSLQMEPSNHLTQFRLAGLIIKTIKTINPSRNLLLEAEQLLLDVLKVEPNNGNATFSLGIVYSDLGRRSDAEKLYKKVLTISPNNKGPLYNLGVELTGDGRYDEAIEYLRQLLIEHPNHVRGLNQIGTCFMLINNTQEAIESFEKVLSHDPYDIATLQNYGLLCLHEKQNRKSLSLFNRLAVLQPNNTAIANQIKAIEKVLGT